MASANSVTIEGVLKNKKELSAWTEGIICHWFKDKEGGAKQLELFFKADGANKKEVDDIQDGSYCIFEGKLRYEGAAKEKMAYLDLYRASSMQDPFKRIVAE